VALAIAEDRKVIDVARSLGVGEGTLGNWVRQAASIRVNGRG
jgi:transposase-like protein